MTPTSPTGADRLRRAGFTLVEVMVVTALIGLAAGAVVMTLPDPRPPVGQQADDDHHHHDLDQGEAGALAATGGGLGLFGLRHDFPIRGPGC